MTDEEIDFCPECGSTNIVSDETSSVCDDCGLIVREDTQADSDRTDGFSRPSAIDLEDDQSMTSEHHMAMTETVEYAIEKDGDELVVEHEVETRREYMCSCGEVFYRDEAVVNHLNQFQA